jgi:hypothetical protein
MRIRRIVVVLVGVIGCAQPVFQPVLSAPQLAPNENAIVVERPPSGAILLGTVKLELSIHKLSTDCTDQALAEARRAGATHIILPPGTPPTSSRGPRCSAQAFYLPPK